MSGTPSIVLVECGTDVVTICAAPAPGSARPAASENDACTATQTGATRARAHEALSRFDQRLRSGHDVVHDDARVLPIGLHLWRQHLHDPVPVSRDQAGT